MSSRKDNINEKLNQNTPVSEEEWGSFLKGIRKINVARHELQKSVVWEILDEVNRRRINLTASSISSPDSFSPKTLHAFEQSVLNIVKALSNKNLDWNEGVPNFSEDGKGSDIAPSLLEKFRKHIHQFENRHNRSEYISALVNITPMKEREPYGNYFFEANWGSKLLNVCQGFSNYEDILKELKRAGFDFDWGFVKEEEVQEALTFKEKSSHYKKKRSVCGWTYVFASGNAGLIQKAVENLGLPADPVAVFNSLLDLCRYSRTKHKSSWNDYPVEKVKTGMRLLDSVCLLSDEELALMVDKNQNKDVFKKLSSVYEITNAVGLERMKKIQWSDYDLSLPPFALMLADYTLDYNEKRALFMDLSKADSVLSMLEYGQQFLPKNRNVYNVLLAGQLKSSEPYFDCLNEVMDRLQPLPLIYSTGNKNNEEHLDFLKRHSDLFIKNKELNYWFGYNKFNTEKIDDLLAVERPELFEFVNGDKKKSPLVAMILYRLINRVSKVIPARINIQREVLRDESYQGFPLDAVLDFALTQRPYCSEPLAALREKCNKEKTKNYYGARIALDIYSKIGSSQGYLLQMPANYMFNVDETAMIIRALSTMGKRNEEFNQDLTLSQCFNIDKYDDIKIQNTYLEKLWPRFDFSKKSTEIAPVFKKKKDRNGVEGDLFRWVATALQDWNTHKSWNLNSHWIYNLKRLLNYNDELSEVRNSIDFLLNPLDAKARFEFILQFFNQLENKKIAMNSPFLSCPDDVKTPEQYKNKIMISFLKRNEVFMNTHSFLDHLDENQKQVWCQTVLALDKNESDFINKEWTKAHFFVIERGIKRSPSKLLEPPSVYRF